MLHVIGPFLMSIVVFAALSRQVVHLEKSGLELELELFGRCLYVRPYTWRQVRGEEIRAVSKGGDGKRESRRRARAVYVDAGPERPMGLGPSLDDAGPEWLRDTLRAFAA